MVQLTSMVYEEHVETAMQEVPSVVHLLFASKATHPPWVFIPGPAFSIVASEHSLLLQILVEAKNWQVPSFPPASHAI